MVNRIMKTVKNSALGGVNLYVMEKVTDAVGQLAINFLPVAVPPALGMAIGGLGLSVALDSFGRGPLLKQSAEFAGYLAVANALTNVPAIDRQMESLTAQVATIGMDATAKAAYIASATAGYRMAGYAPGSSTRGYARVTAGARGGSRGGMRGMTSQHAF